MTQFAARHAPIDKTRAALDSIAAGELPTWWEEFTAHGFHAVHLPEEAGGQGGTLADMACVIEAAAAALLPGPLLSTATASAVASLADESAALHWSPTSPPARPPPSCCRRTPRCARCATRTAGG